MFKSCLVAAFFATLACPIHAAKGDFEVAIYGASYHFDRHADANECYGADNCDRKWNEVNPGLGIEYSISDTVGIVTGAYQNSYSKTTAYAGFSWTPEMLTSKWVQLGIVAGLGTGYDKPWIVLPRLTLDLGTIKVDLVAAPAVEPKGSAFLGLSTRIHF